MDATTGKDPPTGRVAPPPGRRGARRACALVFVGFLLATALYRWSLPELDRPLEYDEWHTIEYYGWAGLTPSGDMKLLRRSSDFERLPAPNARQLGLGLYRAIGIWKEPNNHVLHSGLVNLSTAVERSPRAARIPAFAFAVLFAVAVFILVGPVLEWWWAAPVVGVLAYSLPYVQTYGAQARGYTFVLTLQVLTIALAVLVARRPTSLGLSAALAALSAGCFFNVISLSLDWVFALYLAVYLFPPADARPGWRRNLLAQGLVLGAVFGVFVLDRLPAILLASQRFGEPVRSVGEMADWLSRTARYLFPTPLWQGVAVAGVVGLALARISKASHFVFGLAGVVLLVNLLHFAMTARCPYPRVCGYFLPLVLLGVGALVERAVSSARGGWANPVGIGACCGAVALVLLGRPASEPAASAPSATAALPNYEHGVYAVVLDWDYVRTKSLPAEWQTHQDRPAPGSIRRLALIVDRQEHPIGSPWQVGSTMKESIRGLPGSTAADGGTSQYEVVWMPARGTDYRQDAGLPASDFVLVTWYPDQDRIGLDPGPLMKLFDEYPVAYQRRSVRLQANYDYYVRPGAFEMVAESVGERKTLQDLLTAGLSRYGGRAVVYYSSAE